MANPSRAGYLVNFSPALMIEKSTQREPSGDSLQKASA